MQVEHWRKDLWSDKYLFVPVVGVAVAVGLVMLGGELEIKLGFKLEVGFGGEGRRKVGKRRGLFSWSVGMANIIMVLFRARGGEYE